MAVLAHSAAQLAYPHVGARFLMISSDGKERHPLTGAVQLYRPGQDGGLIHEAVWSPDGTRLALTQPNQDGVSLVVADRAAGTVRTISESVPARSGIATPLTWSPDGKVLLIRWPGSAYRTITGP